MVDHREFLLADVAVLWFKRLPRFRLLPVDVLRLKFLGREDVGRREDRLAAERPDAVGAVVSRGGRPDLAIAVLPRVKAPTLLIVGGQDFQVIEINRAALEHLRVEKKLAIVPGATHLFEETDALEQVARLARDWFARHLTGAATARMSGVHRLY